MDDISACLKTKARNNRIKLISGAGVMLVLKLIFIYLIVDANDSAAMIMVILIPGIIVMFVCAVLLVLRLVKKMEHDSFGEGMHLVMESVPMASALLDKDLKLVYCNEEAPKMYDFESRQEYYDNFFATMPEFQPDGTRTQDGITAHVEKAFQNGKEVFDWWNKTPKGHLVPIRVTLFRAFFNNEVHLLEFTRDLRETHEIKKKEESLKARQQAILDSAPLLCILYDQDSNVLEVNKEAEHIFEIPNKQIFIDNFREFLPKYQPDGSDSFQKSLDTIRKALKEGECRYEWMYQLRDGTPIPTEEIFHRITVEGKDYVIAYSRDLREYYKEREKDKLVQERIRVMSAQLNDHVAEQAAAVTQSSAAIEEMIANIRSVTNTLQKNTDNVRLLQEASGVGHAGLSGVVTDIQGITRESESLMEINSVMQNIASQTNLLSMNAAIEAAHAGEAGMGFAVVANEIRKLAESSAEQSKTISSVLKKIKSSIDTITRSTEGVLKKFDAIDTGVKLVAEQDGNILNAMEEQGQGSKQILQAMGRLNELTQGVKNEAQLLSENSKTIV